MKNVLIRGPLLSGSGYGEHTRQIFQFCETRKDWNVFTQILPWGITPWNVNSTDDHGIYGRIMEKSMPFNGKFDLTIQVQLPNEWDPSLGKINVGVTAGVETDRCSQEWATTHREKMDLLIVPSEHAKSTIKMSGTGNEKTPIAVVPEAFFPELLGPATNDPLLHLTTSKNFLMIGTLTADDPGADRKNLVIGIKWFLEKFSNNSDVGLIIKTSKGRDTTIDRQLVRNLLSQIKRKCNVKNPPKIYMLHGAMTRQEMANVYKSPKIAAFLSTTRGEGFGLPLLEAAVAGIPIVATGWSAHTEFLSGDSFLDVTYDLHQIPANKVDNNIFVTGAKWAEAREGNFKKKMQYVVDPLEHTQLHDAAQSLSQKLIKSHCLSVLFDDYATALQQIEV
jgi:glycosyltransferase involved in cell wall biosynthesis